MNRATVEKRLIISSDMERKVFSQNGEDGVLDAIFSQIALTNQVFVEIGVGDGRENNTRHLALKAGWTGFWFSLEQSPDVPSSVNYQQVRINAENVATLFRDAGVPEEFALLSIDIDGNDYWVWKALDRFRPKVVVIEYNGFLPPPLSKVIPYDPDFQWSGTRYFGASLCALNKLAAERDYSLVYCERRGVNAFFVQREWTKGRDPEEVFRPLSYGGYPEDGRTFLDV